MPTPSISFATRFRRRAAWAALTLAWLGVLAFVPGGSTRGQEPKKDGAAAPPAAAAPAAAEPAPAAAPAAAPAKEATKAPKNMLTWAIEASGPIGFFLLGLSIYFLALVIRLFMEFRLSEAVPPALIDRLEAAIKEKKFQEAYDVCRDDNSFLAKVVRTGIANLPNGRAEAKEAMNETSNEVVITMESRISYLATIGTLGPMIGLVGTIWGMIESFQTIATAANSQPKPDEVAKGISTALFITLEGVSLSVPAIFFYAFFRNRIAQIALEATKVADRTIGAFYSAAKSQPAKTGA